MKSNPRDESTMNDEKEEYTLSLEEFRERTGIEDENQLYEAYQEYIENVQLLKE